MDTGHTGVSQTQTQKAEPKLRVVKVWDFPTRIFHWALVAVMAVAWASSEADGGVFWIHVYSGTLLIGFVAFRAIWGVIGSRHAQFGDFVRGPAEVSSYASRLFSFRPPYTLGHNPLGGWMVVALIAVILMAVLSGLMSSSDSYTGPLAHVGGGLLGDAHEGFANFLLVLIFVHVAGVIAHGFVSHENLPRAMVTGDKHVPGDVSADVVVEDIKPVGIVRPLIALALAMAVVLYFMR